MAARKGDDSAAAKKARTEAANTAARWINSSEWSAARCDDLAAFSVAEVASEDDIEELEAVIAGAKDEKPIQKFLEANPYLLTSLLGGKGRFCIPQKRLGGEPSLTSSSGRSIRSASGGF